VSSQPRGPQQFLLTLFLLAAHELTNALVARLAAAGFTDIRPAHGRVFENIDPHGTRLSDLAVRAQMTHQSMSELVDSLVAAGYLERRPDPADRRAKLICLTSLGRQLLRVAVREGIQLESTWFGQLPPIIGLDALRDALQTAVQAHVGMPSPPDGTARPAPESATRRSPRRRSLA
jgi:DNA-binding MarR family transcriptional regulator